MFLRKLERAKSLEKLHMQVPEDIIVEMVKELPNMAEAFVNHK